MATVSETGATCGKKITFEQFLVAEEKLKQKLENGEIGRDEYNDSRDRLVCLCEKELEGNKDYRKFIDEAEAKGYFDVANDMRYKRYCRKKEKKGEKLLPREKWDKCNERISRNRSKGYEHESIGRESLEDQLGRKLDNNNRGTVELCTSDGYTTRPDSIGRNSEGEIDLIHEHKHFSGEGDQVLYNTHQMRTQRKMLEAEDGIHAVTITSDNPKLNETPPKPRPSGPLAIESGVYYTDTKDGKITHQWKEDQDLLGGGYWEKL